MVDRVWPVQEVAGIVKKMIQEDNGYTAQANILLNLMEIQVEILTLLVSSLA